ncbi:MAG: GldG family protein [Pseudobdellovibrio sp.]
MKGKSRLALGASLICFVALAGLYFALKIWMPFMWAILAPGLVGFGLWLYLVRHELIELFKMKSTKQGLNMGALVLIVLFFLVIVNYLAAKYYKTFDFSGNSINTLSAQSEKIISNLDANLIVKFFYKNGADRVEENKKSFRELIKKYQDKSDKVQFEIVEMNENAKLAKDFQATKGAGEAFIEFKGNKNRIENYTEQDFTNAVIKVTRTVRKNIYFLTGHKERNPDKETDESGVSSFKQMLEKNSYIVKTLSLVTQPEIPEDAHAVVILGPEQNFQSFEIKAIENYLEKGGSVLLTLDERNASGLQPFLSSVGLEFENFYVFNVYNTPMGQVVNAQSPTVAVNYSSASSITQLFGPKEMTVFRQPHALKVVKLPESMKLEILVKTPENSVALKELDSQDYFGQPQSFNLGVEIRGKYGKGEKEFDLVVFSDADFMSNILLYQNLNRDLSLNTIGALAKETDLISISAKEVGPTKLLVAPPEFSQFFKFVIGAIFLPIPILLMIISIVLWLRRRHA